MTRRAFEGPGSPDPSPLPPTDVEDELRRWRQITDWTRHVPDRLIGVVRLSCGHAKLWQRNIGIPGPMSRTLCLVCDETVSVPYEITLQDKG